MKFYKKPKNQFILLLVLFFIINILQSIFTGLFEDEAYYWVWSKNLALGYFDHPPLVALWIKISGFLFDGELGVRLMSTISFSLMLVFIWKTIDHAKKWDYVWLYFLLIISSALLQVFGFVTTPDTPLLLFAAIFLYAYKKFLASNNNFNTLLLGFSMAAMLYSKYHGIVVIGLVVVSNLNLFKDKKFWLASLFGFILFVPHLYWQYINDFPSFRYHLIERGKSAYRVEYTFIHLANQIAIVGITFPLIYWAFFKHKITSVFEKSLHYIVYGFIIFFLFASFSTYPQAQWTGVILIAFTILTFGYFVENHKSRKWLVIIGSIQLIVIVVARIVLVMDDILPTKIEPHIAKTWVPILKEKTEGKPIVFVDSYQNASVYNFYTGIETHSYSILQGRQSQYDLINFENQIQHKDVYAISKRLLDTTFFVKKRKNLLNGFPIDNYTTFQKVTCTITDKLLFEEGKETKFNFQLKNTYSKNIDFKNVKFFGVFQGKKNKILGEVLLTIDHLKSLEANKSTHFSASFVCPKIDQTDKVTFRVALQFYEMLEGYQGNKIFTEFKLKEN